MLLTSCMKNSISKMDNNIVTRVFYTNELPAVNLHDKEIAFYRLNIFDKEFENLESSLYIEANNIESKLDLNLKRDGLKLLKIEALSKQGQILFTATERYNQEIGFSYVKWPTDFTPYTKKHSFNYTVIFETLDSPSVDYQFIDDDFSSIRHIFDKYNCTSCHSRNSELNLTSFSKDDPEIFYTQISNLMENDTIHPTQLKRVSSKDLELFNNWLNVGILEDINQVSPDPLKRRTLELIVTNPINNEIKSYKLNSNKLNSIYQQTLFKLKKGIEYKIELIEQFKDEANVLFTTKIPAQTDSNGAVYSIL